MTVPLDVEESDKTKEAVIAQSRKQYATPKTTVEEYMEGLFEQNDADNKPPAKSISSTPKRSQSRIVKNKGKLHDG